jgi:hypothetical protein
MLLVTNWDALESVPTDVAAILPRALPAAERDLAPADAQAFAVAMDRLLTWVEQFGIIALERDGLRRREQIRNIVAGYRPALADVPADLLAVAVDRTIAQHRYRNLPLPGDIRATVEPELRDRKYLLDRLRTADLKAKLAAREEEARFKHRASDAEKDAVARMMERARCRKMAADETERQYREVDGIAPCNSVREAYAVLKGVPFVHRPPAAPQTEAAE